MGSDETELYLIDPLQDKRWDIFVNSHPTALVSHTSSWAWILTNSFRNIEPLYLVAASKSSGVIKAGLPFCQTNSPFLGRRLISLPFTTLCDPLMSDSKDLPALLEGARSLQKQTKSRFMELRTLQNRTLLSQWYSPSTTYKHHYLTLQNNLEEIFSDVKRTFRQCVNQAKRVGVCIETCKSDEDVRDFYGFYLNLRKRKYLPPLPFTFIHNMWKRLFPRDFLTLLKAKCDGKTAGYLLLLKFNNRVSAEFLCSSPNFFRQKVNHLLVWSGIRLAREQGYEIFDFGRTKPENTGLISFKKAWGAYETEIVHFIIPNSTIRENIYSSVLIRNIMKIVSIGLPDRAYEKLGLFLYNNLI